MRQGLLIAFVCSALCVAVAPRVRAQSLADVAKKEEERRKTVPQPAKVYTNKDLKPVPAPSTPASGAAATPTDAADAKTGDAKATDAKAADKDVPEADRDTAKKGAAADKDKAPAKTGAYWAGRLKDLQDALERDRNYADAMQSRINALTTDFVNRDDPAQRTVVERDRLKSIAELNRLKVTIQTDQRALADFAEEARRAGVPPGWLR